MGGINQVGKEVMTFHFRLRWVNHVISKEFLSPEHGNLGHWLPRF